MGNQTSTAYPDIMEDVTENMASLTYSCITVRSPHAQSQSTFFRLPQELRIEIYEEHANIYLRHTKGHSLRPYGKLSRPFKASPLPALLRTCRRISEEARSIMHQNAKVYFNSMSRDGACMQAIGQFRQERIRNLTINWEFGYSCYRKGVHPGFEAKLLERLFYDAKSIRNVRLTILLDMLWSISEPSNEIGTMRTLTYAKCQAGDLIEFLGKLPQLETVELGGVYGADWIPWIEKKTGVKVVGLVDSWDAEFLSNSSSPVKNGGFHSDGFRKT